MNQTVERHGAVNCISMCLFHLKMPAANSIPSGRECNGRPTYQPGSSWDLAIAAKLLDLSEVIHVMLWHSQIIVLDTVLEILIPQAIFSHCVKR